MSRTLLDLPLLEVAGGAGSYTSGREAASGCKARVASDISGATFVA